MEEEANKSLSLTKDNCSEISIRQFLDFLKTAYQVQDSLEGVLSAGGMTEAVDWLKLKQNDLVKPREDPQSSSNDDPIKEIMKKRNDSSTTTTTSSCSFEANSSNSDPIKRKLSEVLSEGLLDSVLPYLVPTTTQQLSRRSSLNKIQSSNSLDGAKNFNQSVTSMTSSSKKRPSLVSTSTSKSSQKNDVEVEIHVCDEVKKTKKDFSCKQKLLIEKMGYFAEVTSGQKLEDMDISVHCDIVIFDWLMRWVKKDHVLDEDRPQLDPQNVIPILVSAAFLQMEPLQNDCLLYCHQHMNEILRTSTNLTCLNDSILTRLAAMYTNTEVENIKDRKDKIQSRIYTKLINSLVEPDPESVRGHWSSLCRIYRCGKCQQLVTPEISHKIPCVPTLMQLQTDGSIISNHLRDSTWNINDYILNLQKQLKTWRRIYWRLWGDCHFLFCTICQRYFPSRQIGWCRYHPDPPQYFTLDAQKAPLPVGRYPCCGERAYRFQLLPDHTGCQFREHTVCTKNIKDSAILNLLEHFRHLIEEEPPQLMFPERLTRLVARDSNVGGDVKKLTCKEIFWWEGFQIIPPRPKLGLLSNFSRRYAGVVEIPPLDESSSDDQSSDSTSSSSSTSSDSSNAAGSSSSSSTSNQEQSVAVKKKVTRRPRRARKREGRLWQHNLSARSNQDIQRAYEETAIKEMTLILNRKTGPNLPEVLQKSTAAKKGIGNSATPIGGLWVRLESDWRESNNISGVQTKARSIFTGKNRPRNAKLS